VTGEADPALEAVDLWFGYGRGRPVLRGVTLAARAGEVTMILGVSGSGKTTLLKLFKGFLAPWRGQVRALGAPVNASQRARLDPRSAYIPQQLGLVRSLSALENTLIGALARTPALPSALAHFPAPDLERARNLLDRLGIADKAGESVHALSGGERQRVAIARALMQRPRIVLADEFISQLDPVTSAEIMTVVRGIADDGVAVVQTTHEMDIVDRYADSVIVLRDGQKAFETRGPVSQQVIATALRL
jgi:phosphonate transport system ATP-binding protein